MFELVAPSASRGSMAEKAARDILTKHRAAKAQLKFGSVFQYLEEKGESKTIQMTLMLVCEHLGKSARHAVHCKQ